MIGTGAAILGASIIGGGASLIGSSMASRTQARAADQASQLQYRATQDAARIQQENALRAITALRSGTEPSLEAIRIGAQRSGDAIKSGYGNALSVVQGPNNALAPYMNAGGNALALLNSMYGTGGAGSQPFNPNALEAFYQSPDYQAALKGGMQALDFSNAGRGLLRSSEHLRGATQFGQQTASQYLGNYTGRLKSLADMGFGAANAQNNSLVGLYTGQGNALTGLYTQEGQDIARLFSGEASGIANIYTGQGNALSGLQMQGGNALAAGITGAGQATAAGIVGGTNAVNSSLQGGMQNWLLSNYLSRPQQGNALSFASPSFATGAPSSPWPSPAVSGGAQPLAFGGSIPLAYGNA